MPRWTLWLVALLAAALLALLVARASRGAAQHKGEGAPAADSPREAVELELAPAPRADAAGERESAAASRAELSVVPLALAGPPASAKRAATLLARCVDATSGAPVAGVRVSVRPRQTRSWSSTHAGGTKGTLTTSPVTEAEGVVELELPAGEELRLSATSESGARVALDVAPLTPGERREALVEIPSGDDLAYCGRVVDARGAPLAGASVELLRASRTVTAEWGGEWEERFEEVLLARRASGPDGLFELRIASWGNPILRVSAEGFAPAFVEVGDGHETRETAREVPLRRVASLRARLVDGRGLPCLNATVRIAVEARELALSHHGGFFFPELPGPRLELRADASGACTFEGLPSGVPLAVHVEIPGRAAIARDEPPLLGGELREVEWNVDGGCTLAGMARDARGEPVRGVRLWLARAPAGADATYFETLLGVGPDAAREARTAPDGSFSFDDVPAGTWWLGPAAEREEWEPRSETASAPHARAVEVPAGAARVEADVVVQRGLYVEGHVLAPNGEPQAEAGVVAFAEDGAFLTAESDRAGAFALGPLVPGRYEVFARDAFHAPSERLLRSAGDDDVVLRLTSAGWISGRVIDAASGAACAARLSVFLQDAEAASTRKRSTEDDGSFRFEGLTPGRYLVCARGSAERFGLRTVSVSAGRETPDVVVTLAPGARLRLDNRGPAALVYRVTAGGDEIDVDSVAAGETHETVVAPGRLAVHARWAERERTLEVELAPGETRTLELAPDGG